MGRRARHQRLVCEHQQVPVDAVDRDADRRVVPVSAVCITDSTGVTGDFVSELSGVQLGFRAVVSGDWWDGDLFAVEAAARA